MTAIRILGDGPLTRIKQAFNGSIAVAVGDLLYHEVDDIRPFSSLADQGSATANQAYASKRFAGVSADARNVGDTQALTIFPVDTDVEVEIDCVSSTFEIGDYVKPTEVSGANGLENQKVERTTQKHLAIGTVTKRQGSAVTRVQCRLLSRMARHAVANGVNSISENMLFSAFTDGASATGHKDFAAALPAGAIVLGWEAEVLTGFTGDTTATAKVGVTGGVGNYSADTAQSVLAAGKFGSASVAATSYVATAGATPRVTVTGAADFTSIAAGAMNVTIFYIETR